MPDTERALGRIEGMLKGLTDDVTDIKKAVQAQNGRVSTLEKAHERLKVYGFLSLLGLGLALDWLKRKLGLS